ncbi:hypothetical protein, variant [Blastomyces dermatitidis ER-3]|uniref:SH3 domain-containing protein, variant n=2 Tax=Ajellomyces dermatitidis TaxID=5039 RepID=A0A0J9ENJ5_AJEDA|nr:hypothetical protein, variant [Blastomyces dermatitidis ER-3]EQL36705.1 hypothetical protein, variant [Blastomyces dermatitidis ATCC 26199]KMW66855.1 SH3 domain-containing protein, variant [Blastomyces dermatitidis ATCC 18188]OAT01689.1 hypothetical protein, variant [Blastomyces dermatitidis ER-3]
MTRPQIIRADTVDLQGNRSQSTHDQTRQQDQLGSSDGNRTAPHQSLAMRNAEKEAREELVQSPRVSVDRSHADDSEDEMNGHDHGAHHDGIDHYSNGHSSADEGDITDGESDDQLDDDMLDKISSSPSIDDEDIDFEFVYALHTFVATVEGQANATKGDTMVLLDDSNSYWWLVRVVKDGSIGYLPAEHIETPTERLARLNKHRNIDLSATMLGDNAEKSKNPLKKAMRRRNAKTVTFTSSPVYHEPSDVEYSTEEEDDPDDQFFDNDDDEEILQSETNDGQEESHDEDIVVEPLRPKVQTDKDGSSAREVEPDRDPSPERVRANEDSFDRQDDNPTGRSRNGVVRNTDSFFKDDSLETKKISLTPNLLRDDSNNGPAATNDPKEVKGRGSLEAFDKVINSGDKTKDDKKRKEKKSGMLSGLFKRKDKKSKAIDDDMEESENISEESTRSATPPKTSSESSKEELAQQGLSNVATSTTSTANDGPGASVRAVPHDSQADVPQLLRVKEATREKPATSTSQDQISPNLDSPTTTTFLSTSISPVDSSQNPSSNARSNPSKETIRSTPIYEEEYEDMDSPIHISSPEHRNRNNPPDLTTDTSSVDETQNLALSPTPSSPELVEHPDDKVEENSAPTSSTNTPTWSEASLRSYLDDDTDIRDLLIIVHDKSNVTPAGPDHPITGSLFKEESKGLNEMSVRLDELLTGWMARKMKASVAK